MDVASRYVPERGTLFGLIRKINNKKDNIFNGHLKR